MALGIPQTWPWPPNHHFSSRWRAEVYGGTRKLAKLLLLSALPPSSILLVKRKLILCCCSTEDSAKCSTVATALTHFDSKNINFSIWSLYSYSKIAEGRAYLEWSIWALPRAVAFACRWARGAGSNMLIYLYMLSALKWEGIGIC